MPKIALSSGHGAHISGAVGPSPWGLNEHAEAVKVVDQTADVLRAMGVQVVTFEDTTSHDQQTNLETIVNWHNAQTRDLDVSIHFNSNGNMTAPRGTMCLYYSQRELAAEVASAIAIASGLKDLGPSQRTGLYFLAHTTEPAILIETCFVNSRADVNIYHAKFQQICTAIAETVSGHAEPVPPDTGESVLTNAERTAIENMAANSAIARYDWEDRGEAPMGYVKGMAVAYGVVFRKWHAGDTSALDMSRANSHNSDKDALSWYAGIFARNGMVNNEDGVATLRHLWVLLMGLGMRESSGRYCEGRDMSADNVTSDTAEAGLFQMSWNAHTCSPEIPKLLDEYSESNADCNQPVFREGVSCSESDWESYGSGTGRAYQDLAKACPQFACESAAVGLRHLRQHWGPINRYEAEVKPDADAMFQAVETILAAEPEPIPPEPSEVATIDIVTTGSVRITVNGKPI